SRACCSAPMIFFMWISLPRRQFLRCCGSTLAAGSLGLYSKLSLAAELAGGRPLAPKPSHFNAKAKQLIFVFLTGGVSHLDTFDPKPKLNADNSKPIGSFGLRPDESKPQPLLGSKFKFEPGGQSGLMISELFTNLRSVADELCVIRTMHTDIVE